MKKLKMKKLEEVIKFFEKGAGWRSQFTPKNIGRIMREKNLNPEQKAKLEVESWSDGEGCTFSYFRKFKISTEMDGDFHFLSQNNMLFEGEGRENRIRHY